MKERLDVILVRQNLAQSREKARALIMAGEVYVDGMKEDKAGTRFDEDKVSITVRTKAMPYVSRGGLKLEKAVKTFDLDLHDMICMDIGASTGGFTDCMLQNGAAHVYSLDVGRGQLDWKLRQDTRVTCMEKTNFRYVTPDKIPDRIDFAACDVSFISLKLILGPARSVLKDGGEMVCLIKPQFEAGREKVGKKGVVRDRKVHVDVLNMIIDFAASMQFEIKGLDYSPIKGPEGNIEYLLWLRKPADGEVISDLKIDVESVASAAHSNL